MDSQVYDENFQPFPATKEASIGKEIYIGKFDAFCKMHFMLKNLRDLHFVKLVNSRHWYYDRDCPVTSTSRYRNNNKTFLGTLMAIDTVRKQLRKLTARKNQTIQTNVEECTFFFNTTLRKI